MPPSVLYAGERIGYIGVKIILGDTNEIFLPVFNEIQGSASP